MQAITYNKQLREQIDNLRRERLMFEAINSNLDKELARIKRNMAGVDSTASSHSKQLLCIAQDQQQAAVPCCWGCHMRSASMLTFSF